MPTITLALATGNRHKAEELQALLSGKTQNPYHVIPYTDLIPNPPEIIEDGHTFTENALKKLAGLSATESVYFLADDSGLCIDALGGDPGVFSARYAWPETSKEALCQKVLTNMAGKTNRNAHFACVLALLKPGQPPITVEGKVFGTIAKEMLGQNGFGYDPIFIPNGFSETFGQLPPTQKNELSHRVRAMEKLLKEL
ncbi:MAG: RdgB/HAM1 family non-canonical purine NTP pyrophosphatase [Candidatus Margulisiibacteriota bacterium]